MIVALVATDRVVVVVDQDIDVQTQIQIWAGPMRLRGISYVAAGLAQAVGGQLIALCTYTAPPTHKACSESCEIVV